jgi:hypothetical protein
MPLARHAVAASVVAVMTHAGFRWGREFHGYFRDVPTSHHRVTMRDGA